MNSNNIKEQQLLAINSILQKYGNARDLSTLFDGIMQAGYHGADTFRNTWTIFGYPEQIGFAQYWNMSLRGGVASACLSKPVSKRWSSYPEIYDEPPSEDDKVVKRKDTEFERDVQRLVDEHDLWGVLKEFDECQRVGLYGGILITAKEQQKISDLENTPLMVSNGVDGIVGLKPCYESQLDLTNTKRDTDMSSPRFGNPISYRYREGQEILGSNFGSASPIDQMIHWTRAFVFSEYAKGNSVIGRPALMPVFNSLMDWYKTCGSAAEGHFKNAKQRTQMNVTDPQLAAMLFSAANAGSDGEIAQDSYSKMIEKWEKGWGNTLDTAGIEAKVLQAAIADPTGPAGLCLQDICAGMQIPKTELIGFETGERSSTENANSWNVTNQSWRETTGTKLIQRFLMHLVNIGAISPPKSGRIYVEWPDISAPSTEQRIENAVKLATAIKSLNDSNEEAAASSVTKNLLPEVLDIEIATTPIDSPDDGLDDADAIAE